MVSGDFGGSKGFCANKQLKEARKGNGCPRKGNRWPFKGNRGPRKGNRPPF